MFIGYHGTAGKDYGSVVRVFPSGQPVSVADQPDKLAAEVKAVFDPVLAAGQIPFGSFKIPISTYVTTGMGMDVQTLADYLKTIGTCYLTIWHEPENDMTGPQFKTIYRWARNIIKATAPNVLFGPVNMAYQWITGRAVTNPTDWQLTPTEVDFYGVDVYSHTALPSGSLSNNPGWVRWLANIPTWAYNKIILVERGFDLPDADQLALLKDDYNYCSTLGVMGYMPWLTSASGHSYPFGPQSMAQLKSYATQVSAPPPVPTYTQADLDAAKTASYAAGVVNGTKGAYTDVSTYVTGKLNAITPQS